MNVKSFVASIGKGDPFRKNRSFLSATILPFSFTIWKQQSQPHLSTVKINGLRPAVDKRVCPCLYGSQEGESNECFRSRILWYSLVYVRIVLYCHKKFGHHFWAPKRHKSDTIFYSRTWGKLRFRFKQCHTTDSGLFCSLFQILPKPRLHRW